MRTKSDERRQAILRCAAEAFQEAGFEGASMTDIAARLGYSKATLYSYFTSKEALFFQVMMITTGSDFEDLHEILRSDSPNLRQTLVKFGMRVMELVYSSQVSGVRRLLIAEATGRAAEIAKQCYEVGPARTNAVLAEFLSRMMGEGKLKQADPAIASLHFRGLVESEWLDRYLYGQLSELSRQKNQRSTERAVDAFLIAYAP